MNSQTFHPANLEDFPLYASLEAVLARAFSGSTLPLIAHLYIHDRLPSSNTYLMQAPFETKPQATKLCWVLHQTAGRGRLGRFWHSNAEQSLSFSMAFETELKHDSALSSLSPAAGLALAQAFDVLSKDVRVKWPNDLWRDQRKISGLLLEASSRGSIQRVVIGLGVNLFWDKRDDLPAQHQPAAGQAPAQIPGGLFDQPTSSEQRLHVLALAAKAFCQVWEDYLTGSEKVSARFKAWPDFDALHHSPLQLFQGQSLLAQGVNAGVDASGALLLDQGGRIQRFEIGEVSIRPQLDRSEILAK